MRHFFIVIFATISLNSLAQNTIDSNKPYYYYCEMTAEAKSGTGTISYLWMDKTERYIICDKDNQPIIFANVMQVVNHLSKVGWEYINREAIDSHIYYVLRKQVTKDEDAKNGLILLTSDEIKKAKTFR